MHKEQRHASERAAGTTPKRGLHAFAATTPGLLTICLTSCFLWGSAFPCVKIGYRLFAIDSADNASLIAFAGIRFLIAGIMVVAFLSLARRRPMLPSRDDWGAVWKLSLFQTILQYILFYLGLSRATGVASSIIEGSNSFVCVLLSCLAFRSERLTWRKVVGCAIGFLGVALVALGDATSTAGVSFSLLGEGLVLASTFAAAISSNVIKDLSKRHDAALLSGWQFVVGGATMLVLGLAGGGHVAPASEEVAGAAWALLGYLAFISAVAYTLWSFALAENPVSRVAVFGFMNPVFGVILSAVLLDEADAMSPVVAVLALVLISAGIVIVNREPEADPSATA
jgi:drug/metabolite transporter (DMT)-like permease